MVLSAVTFDHLLSSGIYEKIDYLEYLGADSIWLSPFYEYGDADMGYDWTNHTKVDLRFGSEDDLNLLLTELDRRGRGKPGSP